MAAALATGQRFSLRCTICSVETREQLDVLARIGTALADDSRRRILLRLLHGPAYPAAIADDLGLSRANTSNHLSCLRGCGLVVAEPEGRRMRYELADRRLADALQALTAVVLAVDESCEVDR